MKKCGSEGLFFPNAMQICVREPMPFLLFHSIKTIILSLSRDYYSDVQSCNEAKFTEFSKKLSGGRTDKRNKQKRLTQF